MAGVSAWFWFWIPPADHRPSAPPLPGGGQTQAPLSEAPQQNTRGLLPSGPRLTNGFLSGPDPPALLGNNLLLIGVELEQRGDGVQGLDSVPPGDAAVL